MNPYKTGGCNEEDTNVFSEKRKEGMRMPAGFVICAVIYARVELVTERKENNTPRAKGLLVSMMERAA